jgi:hypothetical protein
LAGGPAGVETLSSLDIADLDGDGDFLLIAAAVCGLARYCGGGIAVGLETWISSCNRVMNIVT